MGAGGNSLLFAGLQPDPLGTARSAAHGRGGKRLGQLDRVAHGADCGQRHMAGGPGFSRRRGRAQGVTPVFPKVPSISWLAAGLAGAAEVFSPHNTNGSFAAFMATALNIIMASIGFMA